MPTHYKETEMYDIEIVSAMITFQIVHFLLLIMPLKYGLRSLQYNHEHKHFFSLILDSSKICRVAISITICGSPMDLFGKANPNTRKCFQTLIFDRIST